MTQSNTSSTNTGWILLNSLWLFCLFIPLGLGTYASFFFIGIRAGVRKWLYAGVVYLIMVITGFILINYYHEDHILSDVGVGFIMAGWLTAIGHGFSVRGKYLEIMARNRREKHLAKVERENVSIVTADELKKKRETTPKRKTPKENLVKPKVINVNHATENEISRLPAIHPFLAKEIIKIRKKEKRFKSLEHFARATNIKPHILAQAKDYMKFTDRDVKASEEQQHQTERKKSKGRVVDY